ncbi:23S rRNA (pseudouridine(1915)-N(3))-methyltransferase RlmH [Candidatus Uhrbacteria bacterium]|nr:23S rRNA (pseudouridine(1915)-N(3))-methyltransferase RlmH [Candidatus Uhrbacteria bacterium]
MFRIKIIQVGKMKNGPLKEQSDELLKRLGSYAKIKSVIVKELSEEILKQDGFTLLLSEDGKTMDSIEFANALPRWSEQEQKELTFIIAGPFGFDRTLLKHVDFSLSLSPLTFPHELAYVVLLEQLYRAGTILAGKTYHY